jgi:hypothetical protein
MRLYVFLYEFFYYCDIAIPASIYRFTTYFLHTFEVLRFYSKINWTGIAFYSLLGDIMDDELNECRVVDGVRN